MSLSQLQDAEYINLETYRDNGEPVRTPVWQTPVDEKLHVWTQADSGKVKRIRHTPRVRVCECDWKGNPLSDWVKARARLLEDPEEIDRQRTRMREKYGLKFLPFLGWATIRGRDHVVVAIRSASGEPD